MLPNTSVDRKVEMNDLLESMSNCLVRSTGAVNPYDVFNKMSDRKSLHVSMKPPREVFYRRTHLQTTKPRPKAITQRCSCKYLCFGSPASFKCLSCILYDPYGNGYYCRLCFQHRHPWYRVHHVFLPIDRDESISHKIQEQNSQLEEDRFQTENRRAVAMLQENHSRLKTIADDEKIEKQIRIYGRRTVAIEEKLLLLRRQLRTNLRRDGSLPVSEDEAVILIQRVFRGHFVRRAVSLLIAESWVKAWDKSGMRDFFHNLDTGHASWTPPRLVRNEHLAKLVVVEESESIQPAIWCLKRDCQRRRVHLISILDEAAIIIQSFFRCLHARIVVVAMAKARFIRVWDNEHDTYFYSDLLTETSSWTKPKIFLRSDPPVLLQSMATSRRSPLVNRDTSVSM